LKKRIRLIIAAAALTAAAAAGCTAGGLLDAAGLRGSGELSLETVVAGLKEALRVGSGNAARSVSRADGYWKNPRIRIPMPPELQRVGSTLRGVGLGAKVDDFEKKMNEAAEKAAAEALPVFVDAVRDMTFEDARQILRGGGSAATDYFRRKTTAPLSAKYAPIVRRNTERVGAVRRYNELMERYRKIPLVPKPKFDLDEYVTRKALEGLFTVLAEEERKIRENPAARTTELLRKVFGSR
jgi:hypothetical protein